MGDGHFDRIVDHLEQTMLEMGMDPDLVPQNIDGHFIQGKHAFFSSKAVDDAFVLDLPEEQAQHRGGEYINACDPALTFDSMWSIVMK